MITKISSIKNLAVFDNFTWDTSVIDGTQIREFKEFNIIYGRNYSGKTTLSRIFRALETGQISSKYDNPEFTVFIKGEADANQNNLTAHSKTIRVFNEDFVRENLKFIANPDDDIESFAILGNDNALIEADITQLEVELGTDDPENTTGLFEKLKASTSLYTQKKAAFDTAKTYIDKILETKATARDTGIKYNFERFGDQNYNRAKLLQDIAKVQKSEFSLFSSSKYTELEQLISEKVAGDITQARTPDLKISEFNDKVTELLQRKIGHTGKIDDLIKDAILNKWVKEGKTLHHDREKCAFCNHEIDAERWKELENHFDEEFDRLENDIASLIQSINDERTALGSLTLINSEKYYSKFRLKASSLTKFFTHYVEKYLDQLAYLTQQLEHRQQDPMKELNFMRATDYSSRLLWIYQLQDKLRKSSNIYSSKLINDQKHAKDHLRYKDVHEFIETIKYSDAIKSLETQEKEAGTEKLNSDDIKREIKNKKDQISEKKRQLNDEEKGAIKVNEYLNNFFGHDFLKLKAVDKKDEDGQSKSIRFEIIRDSKKAHHLSEGECSLIAFCYFMAKLDDINTKGTKPVIWIDDPISSLDGNHIFFIYSLINTEIVAKSFSEQLFISTHNLDFLKYLKRLPGADTTKETKTKFRHLVVQRHNKTSSIQLMPSFLREYITEFNFLFAQIHKCANLLTVDDQNHGVYYNFGNNARKFLEVFLYYKYPDSSSEKEKMLKFFGGESLPAILTDRINNEYSHLCGVLERGGLPIEVPEMNSTANLILERIKTLDNEQYESLLRSIGADVSATSSTVPTLKVVAA
ncbi:AAA family ATPase [Dyadobacter sp. LJ53]|uniref:AAA family ATPase n=1 Tax=Dyadobacter chenwenxiniae TaxID=2906456 RepID=UPI001F2CAF8C|nr:AAA family ATPase [Dyadobacter chenwenxiniae]MCF0049570.1 AAA family ATPase [Dyadobacter chenwenxiniae]